jgi:putative aminopeptidase FrvX
MNWDVLKQLCETPAVPGREEHMRTLVRQHLAPLVDSVETDVMGNMIGRRKRDGKPKVMIAAHMDEIGFMVKFVDDKGFLRLQPLGGFDPRQLFAQRVVVHAGRGTSRLTGVLSYTTKPHPHADA